MFGLKIKIIAIMNRVTHGQLSNTFSQVNSTIQMDLL